MKLIRGRGIINSFGAFQTHYELTHLSHVSPASISWIGTTQAFLVDLVGVVTGPMFDRGYLYSLLIPGCFINVLGTMLLSFSDTYLKVFLAQGLCIGVGSGLIYLLSIAVIVPAFSNKRPLAIGLATSAASVGKWLLIALPHDHDLHIISGGVIYPIIFRELQPQLGFGWATRIIGIIQMGTYCASLLLLRSARHDKTGHEKPRAIFDTRALKEMPFVTYVLALLVTYAGYFVPAFYIPTFATVKLHASHDLSFYMLAINNAASLLGRLLPQIIPTRLGQIGAFVLSAGLCGAIGLAWIMIKEMGSFMVFVIVNGFFSGAIITLTTVIIPALSPNGSLEAIGTRMGMAYGGIGVGSLIGSPIAGSLSRPTKGDFLGAQIWSGVTLVAGAIILILPWRATSRMKE